MAFWNKLKSEKGMALFIALMLTLMMTIVGLGIIKSANDELMIAGNEMQETKSFYAAEAGLEKAMAYIQDYYDTYDHAPDSLPAETLSVNGIMVYYMSTEGDTVTTTLSRGSMLGLVGRIQPFYANATAVDTFNNSAMTLKETFQVGLVPIFQYSVFYENDLEIYPDPSIFNLGRIHSNGSIYLQSGKDLNIESYLTAHGDIHHGADPNSGIAEDNGNVDIADVDGAWVSMKDGSGWMDCDYIHWFDSATSRWEGRVQDASFGQKKIQLPVQEYAIAYDLIERESAHGGNPYSMERLATFKISDGDALWWNGVGWIDVTDTLKTLGILAENIFYDAREGTNVDAYDFDLGLFTKTIWSPANHVMWIDDKRPGYRATRLNDAAEIFDSIGFTIASENPIYTRGDVNVTGKVPMAVICDALTFLSDNWEDSNATKVVSQRIATSTDINLCFITGNKRTTSGNYSGGLENLAHFLEDWGLDDTLTFRGSMVCLWESQVSNSYPSEYVAPYRDYAFDSLLYSIDWMPPETPKVRSFIRMGWRQENVGYVFNDSTFANGI